MKRDILLTGIPRSGTTLCCSLLNRLPDVLALVEPLDMSALRAAGANEDKMRFIARYADTVRADVQIKGQAPGQILTGEGMPVRRMSRFTRVDRRRLLSRS